MRINARLDKEMARKLKRLLKATRQSKTEIIKCALDSYDREVGTQDGSARAADILKDCGFVGCGAADRRLSEHYKAALNTGLKRKV